MFKSLQKIVGVFLLILFFPAINKSENETSWYSQVVPPAFAATDSCNIPGKPKINYKTKGDDLDWRSTGKTHLDALTKAFESTGYTRDKFTPTAWANSLYGKRVEVQWDGPDAAQVSMDCAHSGSIDKNGLWNSGPDAPHIGWTVGKKTTRRKGHILIDSVLAGRPPKDGDPDE